MSIVEEVSDARVIKDLISTNACVVIDFMAQWCGPCKMIAPKIKKLAEIYPSVKFIKVDVDRVDSAFVQSEDISAMPTFRFYKNGQALESLTVVGADIRTIQANVKHITE